MGSYIGLDDWNDGSTTIIPENQKPDMQAKDYEKALQLIKDGDFDSLETLAREFNIPPAYGAMMAKLIAEKKADLANQVGKESVFRPATPQQKEEIIRLLNNILITRHEKTMTLLNLNKLDQAGATQTIGTLSAKIKDREGQENAA